MSTDYFNATRGVFTLAVLNALCALVCEGRAASLTVATNSLPGPAAHVATLPEPSTAQDLQGNGRDSTDSHTSQGISDNQASSSIALSVETRSPKLVTLPFRSGAAPSIRRLCRLSLFGCTCAPRQIIFLV